MFSQVSVCYDRGVPQSQVLSQVSGLRFFPRRYPNLWSHVLSQGVPQPLVPCAYQGYSSLGLEVPQDRGTPSWDWGTHPWPGQDWGTPSPARTGLTGVPPPLIQDKTGVPPPSGWDWGTPPPPPGTGYAAGGMPLAVSSRSTFLFN